MNIQDRSIVTNMQTPAYVEKIFYDALNAKGKSKSARLSKFIDDVNELGFKLLKMHYGLEHVEKIIRTMKLHIEELCHLYGSEVERLHSIWDYCTTYILCQIEEQGDIIMQTAYNQYIERQLKTMETDVMYKKEEYKIMSKHIKKYIKLVSTEYVSICNGYAAQLLSEYGHLLNIYTYSSSRVFEYYDMHNTISNTLLNEHACMLQTQSTIMYISNMLITEHKSLIDELEIEFADLIVSYKNIPVPRGRRSLNKVKLYTRWRSLSPRYMVLDE
jgi:hypothetical protein